MDITRRGMLGALGVGIGGVGLTAATGLKNPIGELNDKFEGDDTDEPNDHDKNDKDGKTEAHEKGEKDRESEHEGSDGNDHAEQNEGNDNGSVGNVKLSEQQAKDIATKKLSGTVQRVELEKEDAGKHNGTPVYNVVVKTDSGTLREVTVDANSGTVLKIGSA